MSIIGPKWFYYADLISKLSDTLRSVLVVSVCILVFSILWYLLEECDKEKPSKGLRKALIISVVSFCISGIGYIVIPSEDTMYKMLIAKNVTYENIEKGK